MAVVAKSAEWSQFFGIRNAGDLSDEDFVVRVAKSSIVMELFEDCMVTWTASERDVFRVSSLCQEAFAVMQRELLLLRRKRHVSSGVAIMKVRIEAIVELSFSCAACKLGMTPSETS